MGAIRKITIIIFIATGLAAIGCNPVQEQSAQAQAQAPVQHPAPPPADRDPNRLWCNEHAIYEDECLICHPELAQEPVLSGFPAPEQDRLYCREHRVYEHECGICHPELLSNLQPGQGLKVRFPSIESTRKAGVRTGFATEASIQSGVEVLGAVTYNRNALAIVTPYEAGVIQQVFVDVGDEVQSGQVLLELRSPMVAEAKSAYTKALADLELHRRIVQREEALFAQQMTSRQEVDVAEAEFRTAESEVSRARQALVNLGLTAEEVDHVRETGSTSSTLPVRAPFRGTIVHRDAVLGAAVPIGARLFQLADLSTMWMELAIPESEIAGLTPGMAVEAQFDAVSGSSFEGQLTWIAPEVDEQTRLVPARAIFPNEGRHLKHGYFGLARIADRIALRGLTAPKDAVQVVDGRTVVFAKLEEDLYETRLVRVGPAAAGRVAILEGLTPNDQIAVAETYVLKSELLKARLGAGCVD